MSETPSKFQETSKFETPSIDQPRADLPHWKAERISQLRAKVRMLRDLANGTDDVRVTGPRGQALTVREVYEREVALRKEIEADEAHGSHLHHRVSPMSRIVIYALVAVIDFPIMLFVTSSVFNVDWSALT